MCGCNKSRQVKMQPSNYGTPSQSQLTRRTISPSPAPAVPQPINNNVAESQNLLNMNEDTLRKEKLRREAIRRSLGR